VLEHVPDPIEEFVRIHNSIKSDGLLHLEVSRMIKPSSGHFADTINKWQKQGINYLKNYLLKLNQLFIGKRIMMFKKKYIVKGKNCKIDKKAYIGFEEHGGKIILGNNVVIRHDVILRTCTGIIKIGNFVSLGYHTIIHALGGISIGDYTLISPCVQIYAQNHGIVKNDLIRNQKQSSFGIEIGSDCWIGAGAIITDDVKIQNGVVIGAGSIIPSGTVINEYEIWAGNPAKKIGERY
jgi:acetyltransferase-like isoleucine patch superfamily enzyme